MRIVVHDFGGYAFPAQLSRRLAQSGHQVLHLVCAEIFAGKAHLGRRDGDPAELEFESVSAGAPLRRYAVVRRIVGERRYGKLLARRINTWKPDVVLSANTPLFAQQRLFSLLNPGTRRVIWLQDLVSVAMADHLASKSRALGAFARKVLGRLELELVRGADHSVVITPQFTEHLVQQGIDPGGVTVIRNWAPLEDLPLQPRMNHWRARQPFRDDFLFVYSGTLGLKHDAQSLKHLALSLPPGMSVVVLAQGPGAELLRLDAVGLPNLHVIDFASYEDLPAVLGAADVLLAILEPNAAAFSVPSKTLTYLCAGRPVLAALPSWNLAAQILTTESGAGAVVAPGDRSAFVGEALHLAEDPDRRGSMGRAGRAYAESAFDIDGIAREFEAVLARAVDPASRPAAPATERTFALDV